MGWVCLGYALSAACAGDSGPKYAPGSSAATQTVGTGAAELSTAADGQAGPSPAPAEAGASADISLPTRQPDPAQVAAAGAAAGEDNASMQPMAADAANADGGGSAQPPVMAAFDGCPLPPDGASAAEISALNGVNRLRHAAGSPCVTLDLTIGKAASAHCAYYAMNKDTAPECTVSPHYEVVGCAGFTGTTPMERMRAAGFASSGGGEVMAFLNEPSRAVQTWVDSVWHRIPILDPATRVLGYGSAPGCDTIDFGPSMRREALSLVAYPYDGQLGVTTAFDGRYEGPMPPMPTTGWPSANPISLYGQQLLVTEHLLFVDGDSTPLDHTWLDPTSPILPEDQQSLLRNVVFMYANQPYLPNTTYRVKISGTYAGGSLAREWTFTTGTPPRRSRP